MSSIREARSASSIVETLRQMLPPMHRQDRTLLATAAMLIGILVVAVAIRNAEAPADVAHLDAVAQGDQAP